MKMFRPYKAVHDYLNEDTKQHYSSAVTINLFDVRNWLQVDNHYQKFDDNVERTEVICEPNNSFYLRVNYKDFDNIMTNMLIDYRLIDTRSLVNFDLSVNINSKN